MQLNVSHKSSSKLPQWLIAGVVYGKDVKTYSVKFDKNEFIKLYRQTGASTPFDLVWDGIKQMVLIHDFQKDNVSNMIHHVDFLAIDKNKKVQTYVPLVFLWESLLEKNGLGRIQYVKDEILIEALPSDLPHTISIDISSIHTLNDSIFVSDFQVSDKIVIKEDMELPVVVAVPIVEEVDEAVQNSSSSEDTTKTSESANK